MRHKLADILRLFLLLNFDFNYEANPFYNKHSLFKSPTANLTLSKDLQNEHIDWFQFQLTHKCSYFDTVLSFDQPILDGDSRFLMRNRTPIFCSTDHTETLSILMW